MNFRRRTPSKKRHVKKLGRPQKSNTTEHFERDKCSGPGVEMQREFSETVWHQVRKSWMALSHLSWCLNSIDCVLRALRAVYSKVDVKLSDIVRVAAEGTAFQLNDVLERGLEAAAHILEVRGHQTSGAQRQGCKRRPLCCRWRVHVDRRLTSSGAVWEVPSPGGWAW